MIRRTVIKLSERESRLLQKNMGNSATKNMGDTLIKIDYPKRTQSNTDKISENINA